MKNTTVKILISFFFFEVIYLSAQFNTLMPTQPVKEEHTAAVISRKVEKSQHKKDRRSNSLFGIRRSVELDSLRELLKGYRSLLDENKTLFQKVNDSAAHLSPKKKMPVQPVLHQLSLLEPLNKPELIGSKISMPLRNEMTVTSPYGWRIHPMAIKSQMHRGVDLKGNNENVYAVLDGVISETGWDAKGGGNFIKINHYGRFETAYLHLSQTYYKVGEKVRAGFIIAKSGNTGSSTGPHLHFAVREEGQIINPLHFLHHLLKANNLIINHYGN